MALLASEINEEKVHGLGLIAKKPAKNYRRGNMLSRDIALYNGKPIFLRTVVKTILTNATRSAKLTTNESHYLACMALESQASEPLTDVLI